MPLQEITYSIDQTEFIDKCIQTGVVLDVCVFEIKETEIGFEISKQAAIEAMKRFSAKHSNQYFQITIDQTVEPKGRRLAVKEFLGAGFDFENERVNLFRYNFGSRSSLVSEGFLRALLDPPYSLRLRAETEAKPFSAEYGVKEQEKMTTFLFEYLEKILGVRELPDFSKYEIYTWSDDWSNYFDSGKEWWGCFYWTLLNAKNRTITVIAGSATD